jgi:hypothetical protein
MFVKRPLCPERIRKPPAGFNWLDHRLVREHYIDKCSHQAAALYLFLVTVADVEGLSYYSGASLMERLSMDSRTLSQARRNLVLLGLIAYKKPLYQVLSLDDSLTPSVKTIDTSSAYKPAEKPLRKTDTSRIDGLKSIKEILKKITEDKP